MRESDELDGGTMLKRGVVRNAGVCEGSVGERGGILRRDFFEVASDDVSNILPKSDIVAN